MSENNVENTAFKIDDVNEDKSQFELDNERRAQLEQQQSGVNNGQNGVSQEPIHISHKTQIVDNFFDGAPPVRKNQSQNQQVQNTNMQSNTQGVNSQQNVQQINTQQQNVVNNVVNTNNQTNTPNNQVSNQGVNVDEVSQMPPIKLPKHNTVIVDNNLDVPKKKVTSQNANNNVNTKSNIQNVQNQTQAQVQNTASQQSAVNQANVHQNMQQAVNVQQNRANIQNSQTTNSKVQPQPIKLPKHETVIVDNNLDMPRKKPEVQNANSNASSNKNIQNNSQNNVQNTVTKQNTKNAQQTIQPNVQNQLQGQVQNTASQQSAVNQANVHQNQANIPNKQTVNTQVKTEMQAAAIKLPKGETVIVDNNLDIPIKRADTQNVGGNLGNTNQNVQVQHQNHTQEHPQDTVVQQNPTNVQQNQNNAQQSVQQSTQQNISNVDQEQPNVQNMQTVQPVPIKMPKGETVIVDNNLDKQTGKKNKKNKHAAKNAKQQEKASAKQQNVTKQEVNQNVVLAQVDANNQVQPQNNIIENPNVNAQASQEEVNVKPQDIQVKAPVDTVLPQTEKSGFLNRDKKVNSYNEKEFSNNTRINQNLTQDIDEIISLITPDMYAGFWVRCLAFLIDALFVKGLMNIALYFGIESYIPISIVLVYMVVFALYSFIFVYLFDGQTIGKMIMGIKVVEENGQRLRFFTAFVREFAGKLIMFPLFILFIFTVFSYKKHSIMDFLSDTSVIKCRYEPLYDELVGELED